MSGETPSEPPAWASVIGPYSAKYRLTAKGALALDGAADRIKGKVVIITGGSSGIGVESTKALIECGALVYVGVRDTARGRSELGADILAPEGDKLATPGKAVLMPIDLAELASVRAFAAAFLSLGLPLNVLLLNAGVMALPERVVTKDGKETMMQVNWLSNHLLANLLAPALVKGAAASQGGDKKDAADDGTARLVIVASCAHLMNDTDLADLNLEQGTYDKRKAYAHSKSAAVHLANEFDKRYKDKGVRAFSLHPGGIMTGLQKHMTQEEKVALGWVDAEGKINPMFKTVEEGASCSMWAVSSPSLNGKGGVYLEDANISVPSPQWPLGFAKWVNGDEASMATAGKLWEAGNAMLGESF